MVAELVPIFFVGSPAAGGVGGVEHDGGLFAADDAFAGDDVPDVFGDDVGGNEIEIATLVAAPCGADIALVAAFGPAIAGGLDLHADEVSVGFDDRVVAGGVSPGVENLEAVFGGGGDKLQFRPLAAALVVLDSNRDSWF